MTLAVVQSTTNSLAVAGSTTTNVTLGSAPTSGNLLVAMGFLYKNNGAPSANTGWNVAASTSDATTDLYYALYYKYAGAGESTTQQPEAGGRNIWGLAMWEVSGVTGTWAVDYVASHLSANAGHGSNTGTISGFNTTDNNELVLGAFSSDNFTPSSTIATTLVSPTATISTQSSGTHTGAFGETDNIAAASFGTISSSGTAISGTFAVTGVAGDMHYGILELGSTSSTETATATIKIAKPTFSVGAARTETTAVGVSIGKMKFTAAAARARSVNASLEIAAPVISAAAFDLGVAGGGAVHFATFGA